MSIKGIRILDPRGEAESVRYPLAPRIDGLNGKQIALMSNHAPNADLLFQKLEALLARRFPAARFVNIEKPDTTSRPEWAAFITGIGY